MEIRTCEQYVIAELEAAQNKVAYLTAENGTLNVTIGRLKAELAKRETPMERHIAAEGRAKTLREVMYVTCTPVRIGEKTLTFEQWRDDCMGYYSDGCEELYGMGEEEFVRYFEPELRAAYDEKLAELREGD